ncbi:GNAT family N-acetyltransferase [Lacibacterium aquatile]|uniref:GNAT family N-acetyltransferase n=1 Tax=Lacibacterium aquatile TaxID=1168082 RepID=A0ABW5DW36_9PROT
MDTSINRENLDARVSAVRLFNRFYTRQIGVLNEGLLRSPYSLTECRVLYELAEKQELAATDLVRDLALDAGYLSRLLKNLRDQGLIAGKPSPQDGRQTLLYLTQAGNEAFAILDKDSAAETAAVLSAMTTSDQARLLLSMAEIRVLLGREQSSAPITLRDHRPGDMGWIVHRQARLYAEEYAWNGEFEALIAQICGKFIEEFQPDWERCWIAERTGTILGSVFVVKQSEEIAKLRMLYVEPAARGSGLGQRLVEECITFARAKGYRTLTLWTNGNLTAARKIYDRLGFTLTKSEQHHSFGHDLIGENWDLAL